VAIMWLVMTHGGASKRYLSRYRQRRLHILPLSAGEGQIEISAMSRYAYKLLLP